MDTIPHRELRNQSSKILARVAEGESIVITNHGKPTAVISPAHDRTLERLLASGAARPPRAGAPNITNLPRARGITSQDVLADLRGDR